MGEVEHDQEQVDRDFVAPDETKRVTDPKEAEAMARASHIYHIDASTSKRSAESLNKKVDYFEKLKVDHVSDPVKKERELKRNEQARKQASNDAGAFTSLNKHFEKEADLAETKIQENFKEEKE